MRDYSRPARDGWHRLYMITGPDGRAYVGMTNRDVEGRLHGHVSAAYGCYGHTFAPDSLQRAIVAHGIEAFAVEHVASAPDRASARLVERQLIIQHHTRAPNGFNLRTGRGDQERDVIDLRRSRNARAA